MFVAEHNFTNVTLLLLFPFFRNADADTLLCLPVRGGDRVGRTQNIPFVTFNFLMANVVCVCVFLILFNIYCLHFGKDVNLNYFNLYTVKSVLRLNNND